MHLEEFEGTYGIFTLSERLLHRIWLRGDFEQKNIRTVSGKKLKIVNTGTWNLQEGPDFKNAVLELEGQRIVGDIEIHFREKDWLRHKHTSDNNYKNVILHVVLFRPCNDNINRGNELPLEVLPLFELLTRDLEEYAIEDSILSVEDRNYITFIEYLLQMPLPERRQFLVDKAKIRWEQKRQFMKQRLNRFGWSESLHQLCLESLGFKRNRMAMSKVALYFPLKKLFNEDISAEFLFETFRTDWKLAGLRPANHPKRRLDQYLKVLSQGDWTMRVSNYLSILKTDDESIADYGTKFRKKHELKKLRESIRTDCVVGAISGSRFDTVVTDVFFPLYSTAAEVSFFSLWFNWFPGDLPESFSDCLRQCQVTNRKDNPCSNGWNQAILQVLLEGESAFK